MSKEKVNQEIEVIDSSKMTVLAEFDYVDEPMDNITYYYLGVLDNLFIVRVKGEVGNTVGATFFERANYKDLIRMIEDVYAGKLYETNQTALEVEKGKDDIIVSVMSAMPHTATRPIERLFVKNVRRAKLDKLQLGGFDVTASLETGRKLLAEMKRIAPQVIS